MNRQSRPEHEHQPARDMASFGDTLSRDLANVIMSRPGTKPAPVMRGAKPTGGTKATETEPTPPSRATTNGAVEMSPEVKQFMDRHPRWVDTNGELVSMPRFAAKGANADIPGRENVAPPSFEERNREYHAKSERFWSKLQPGYMERPEMYTSSYSEMHQWSDDLLNIAKNCSKSTWRTHKKKTDTTAYVEAAAKERNATRALREAAERHEAEAAALKAAPAGEGTGGDAGAGGGGAAPAENAAPAPPTEAAPQA